MSDRNKLKIIGMEIDDRKERQLHILSDDRMDKIQQGKEYMQLHREINLLNIAYKRQKTIAFLQ